MPYFAVSYQLNIDKDYQLLWDELAAIGGQKVMRSFYFLDIDNITAIGLRDHLMSYIDKDDQLAVVEFSSKPGIFRGFTGTKAWVDARF